MQQIKIKEIKEVRGRTGTIFYAVTDDKGGEFTTFDPNIVSVNPGSLLEIDVKVDGKYTNIQPGWKLLEAEKREEVKVPAPPEKGAEPKPTYGKTSAQIEAERRSIEAQTAYKGIIELISSGKASVKNLSGGTDTQAEIPDDIMGLIFHWARVRLGGNPMPNQPKEKPSPEPELSPDAPGEAREAVKQETRNPARTEEISPLNIEPDWLMETLKVIHWTENTAKSWLKANLKVETVGNLTDICNKMPAEKLQVFTKKLVDMRESAG